jgi:hypothetical protein
MLLKPERAIKKHCQHWAHHKAGKLNRSTTRLYLKKTKTAYSSRSTWVHSMCYSIFSFMCMFCRSLFVTKIDAFYEQFWYFYSLRSKRSLKKRYKNQKWHSRNTANIGHTKTKTASSSRSTCVHSMCYSIFSFMCMFCRSLFVTVKKRSKETKGSKQYIQNRLTLPMPERRWKNGISGMYSLFFLIF